MLTRQIGGSYIFNYPDFGIPDGYPGHSAHSGQLVVVLAREGRQPSNEAECGECMYKVRASDNWEGFAWASELGE